LQYTHTALTNFFNLSNIHPVSRRSSGMVRTSQCFRTEYSQLVGPRRLAAAELIACSLIPPASLINPDHGILLSRFFSAQMAISRVEFSLRVYETVPIYLSSSTVLPFSMAMRRVHRCEDLESSRSRQRVNRKSGHTSRAGSRRHRP